MNQSKTIQQLLYHKPTVNLQWVFVVENIKSNLHINLRGINIYYSTSFFN